MTRSEFHRDFMCREVSRVFYARGTWPGTTEEQYAEACDKMLANHGDVAEAYATCLEYTANGGGIAG